MDYDIEALGDDRFQKLCQSILTATYPNVQCLPVNQPDGGRDAFARSEGGVIIFQVKFSRNPSNRSERDAVEALISSEKSKVAGLVAKGATSYVLLTNVSGTSHLDAGSIDRTQAELSAAFGIPAMCWWRDDIERRIEAIDGLIWRYPELLRSTDFLEAIALKQGALTSKDAYDVFRSYMEAQYVRDSEVKFQQVQIQNLLLDLFTDTPIAFAREKQPKPLSNACSTGSFQQLSFPAGHEQNIYYHHRQTVVHAADWLLRAAPERGLQRIVLEGAPGQGKSTVTQYISQVHRLKSSKNFQHESRVPEHHLEHLIRLPFRVDLRDYSTWLADNDPFAGSKAVPRPAGSIDTLESFIAHQVKHLSGGRQFDVNMLTTLLDGVHCLIVLDGFDEVADVPTRIKIIEQTRLFAARVQRMVMSAQLIVTSRPNAFILSSGFPEREWMHLSLRPLQVAQISEYADKWIVAKELSPIRGKEFKDLLGDRISRPHIRSLAQNPMQLAILLNLINTKGLSLPDKRTALYESYMDLFFGREAEKDEVVRENRDVLMQIHEYVAWMLQTDAERPGGAGSITQEMLEQVVGDFLASKGHEVDVLKLFKGAVERVGALVSRVQGMIEFEVQPLREFFTGRYLYVSAPYSTLGNERGGSRPRRFAALAKRPYWSNVARFYAGCYNSGELASLLSGLEEVHDEASEASKGHALQLGLLLLSDWVFAQEPRIVSSVIEFLALDRNFEHLIANQVTWEENRIALPVRCGRAEMGRAAIVKSLDAVDVGYAVRAGDVAVLNSAFSVRMTEWQKHVGTDANRLEKAVALGIFGEAPREVLDELIAGLGPKAIEEAVAAGRWKQLSPGEMAIALERAATHLSSGLRHYMFEDFGKERVLLRALWLLSPSNYTVIKYSDSPDYPLTNLLERYGLPDCTSADREESSAPHLGLTDFVTSCERALDASRVSWISTLDPWSDLVESGRRTWGQTLPLMTLAAIAAGIRSKSVRALEFDDLLARQMPLAERARHARLRTNLSWWVDQWSRATSDEDRRWLSLMTVCWGAGPIVQASLEGLSDVVDGMTDSDFEEFSRSVDTVMAVSPGGRPQLTGLGVGEISAIVSTRLAFVLTARLSDLGRKKARISIANRAHGVDDAVKSRVLFWLVSSAYREPSLWDEAISLAKRYGDALRRYEGERRPGRAMHYGGRSGMARKTAEGFLRDAGYRPMVLVEAAVSSVRQLQASDRRPLGEVASEEGWFEART